MSLDNDKLDHLYRSRFNEYELPVSDRVLVNIHKELLKEKRKRRLGYWKWLFIFLVATAGATTVLLINPKPDKQQSDLHARLTDSATHLTNVISVGENKIENISNGRTAVPIENNSENISKTNEVSNVMDESFSYLNEQSFSTNKSGEKETVSETEPMAPGITSRSIETISTGKKINREPVKITASTDNNEQKTAQQVISQPVKATNAKSKTVQKKNSTFENEQSIDPKSTPGTSDQVSKQQEKKANNQRTEQDLNSAINEIKTNESTDSSATITSEKSDPQRKLTSIPDSLVSEKDTVKTEKDTVSKNAADQKAVKKSTEKNKPITSENVFYIELNGGPSRTFRSLPGSGASVQSRNELEKSRWNYNAGIDVGALLKGKYMLNTGLGIEHKGETYNFSGKAEVGHWTYKYDTLGNIQDSNFVIEKKAVSALKTQNKYQFLRFPIMIGYQFPIGEKWIIAPVVGVNINYLLSATSSWIDPETDKTVNYSHSSFSSFSFAARARLDIGYYVSKWCINIQPGYTRFLQSIYKKSDPAKLYPYSYDLNVGLRYYFRD